MLIYFDESYDSQHNYLILGALFNPHPRFLHKELSQIKEQSKFLNKDGTFKELKYNKCLNDYLYKLCCSAIDIFLKSTSYFRCIVIDQNILDLSFFGKKSEDNKIKMARAYKKFAELLISHNAENIYNGVLLTDELKRCQGDKFIELMKQDFCLLNGKHCNSMKYPTLREIADIHSDLDQYQVCQINDILIGCVLNNLAPTKNKYKNNLRNYLIKKIEVDSLLQSYWNRYSRSYVEKNYPKFNVWYWNPIKKTKKPS